MSLTNSNVSSSVPDQTARPSGQPAQGGSVIETLQSLIIAFAFAFIFRAFVAEAFVIPTGSMAPTLYGAHVLARSEASGYEYAVGVWETVANSDQGEAMPYQATRGPVEVPDPMLERETATPRRGLDSATIIFDKTRTRMGDRILVLKYLYTFFDPQRFDVVVFKNPTNPAQNFIKRLIGLPGETIWLADGDVFASTSGPTGEFRIQRKPDHVQRAVWQPVYHSEYIPLHADRMTPPWKSPWSGRDWDTTGRSYRWRSSGSSPAPTALAFDAEFRPIVDRNPYNDGRDVGSRGYSPPTPYATADIRLAAAVEPADNDLKSSIRLSTMGHEFIAALGGGSVHLRMRPQTDAGDAPWQELATGAASLPAGKATNVEFWHVDQSLSFWIEGKRVAYGDYEWSPADRLDRSTGLPPNLATETGLEQPWRDVRYHPKQPSLTWEFEGTGVTLHRIELDRDLYYQPAAYGSRFSNGPALGTHPDNLAALQAGQFFCLGDNSAASSDGRLWDPPVPWVAHEIDPTQGVVPRDLLLGKAFFVYFPSPEGVTENGMRFVPNFGEMRFIR